MGINVPISLNGTLQVRVFCVTILFYYGYLESWVELKFVILLTAILFLRSCW